MILSVQSLSRSFGGIAAVSDVSFEVQSGHVHAVIGPNGAGKTTLFNLISGVYAPSSGSIHLDGHDITGCTPEELASRGMSRTFQNLQVGMNMTAIENVMLGAHLQLNKSFWAGIFGLTRTADKKLRKEAASLMEYVGIGEYTSAHATQLSFGVLKRLEIARALAAKPRLLLLDEPAAGLNDSETHAITMLIRQIAEGGITVLLVEHDMKMVMDISDYLIVLDQGQKLAEGNATTISQNPAVVAAYLGTEE